MKAIRLDPNDAGAAGRVFARSFFDYPMMIFYWPDTERRKRYLEWYLGCAINYGLRYGQIFTTPAIEGISIWLPPGETHTTSWRYARAGFLPTMLYMGLQHYFTQAIKNEELVMKTHREIMPGPHWYLWAIAVDPEKQSQGVGSILIQPGLQAADAQQVPCYVETHAEENLPFYQNKAFELVRIEQVPGFDLRFWCFVREPHSGGSAKTDV
jgi:ribosomal protein S18 acetylase RimI-like enzyme